MANFHLKSKYRPAGDQPEAITALIERLKRGVKNQVLLGVTGSGKTYTMANVIANYGRPTLVISHNKTLAAQLYLEFRELFPNNAVHYFVSYFDYYQPEAYLPSTDTYIEKDSKVNEEIDRLRHAATQALMARDDVIIVASVSCIYNLGNPEDYKNMGLELFTGKNNTARQFGGGLYNQDGSPVLLDVIFDNNQTEQPISPGGGMHSTNGNPSVFSVAPYAHQCDLQ